LKQLLLVGAGHAHLHVLKQLGETSLPDTEVTLLAPSRYQYYSGMFSGCAEGLYTLDDMRINIEPLADQSGTQWIKGAAISVDPERKVILTDKGKLQGYDMVSFDIGSLTQGTDIPGVVEHANTVKPNYRMADVIEKARHADRLVVVGGGAGGVEMSLSLQSWRVKNRKSSSISLISAGELLQGRGRKAAKKAASLLNKSGVDLYSGDSVKKVMQGKLVTKTNRILPFDTLLWLTGAKPQKLFINGNLPVDEKGYLLVEDTLQVKRYPSIFAAGDCATLSEYPNMEKSGVHAVRQAPVLWENLKGFLGDGNGEKYVPPPSTLSILSTGNKTGLFLYKGKAFYGKWVWKMKNRIDRRFMKQYQ
jgi:NADH dehydrogenase FAD-containing subunit